MSPLVQICVVIVTLAFVAGIATMIRVLLRIGDAAARLTTAAQDSMTQMERIATDTHELLGSLREMMPPAQRVVKRFERLGDRAADLSAAVLNEIEPPVMAAVAAVRGIELGGARLITLLARRFAPRHSSHNGDPS